MLTVDGGRPLRVVSVVNALVTNAAGQTLIEKHQVMPSGAVRERGKPLGEKMLPGESWREGVLRGIREELGPVLPGEPQVGPCSWAQGKRGTQQAEHTAVCAACERAGRAGVAWHACARGAAFGLRTPAGQRHDGVMNGICWRLLLEQRPLCLACRSQ